MKASCLLAVAALVAAAGVQAQGVSMPLKSVAASSAAKATVPLVDGEVRKVDASRGFIILKHGDIPNLGMGAMTMGFEVADRKMLKGLKVGQKVRFQAEMVEGKATVTELKPVR